MSDPLTSRLLAEIERREEIATTAIAAIEARDPGRWWGHEASPMEYEEFIDANDPATVLAYLAALRKVVELCGPYDDMQVRRQTRTLANRTLRAVAEAMGVSL